MATDPESADQRDTVAVIGLGAIGGSVARALISAGSSPRGYTQSAGDAELARQAGVAMTATLDDAVRGADVVLIAVPMDVLPRVSDMVVRAAPPDATILHASSLQRLDAVKLYPATAMRVFGTHPLAGTQGTGFAAASADMFAGATVYVESRASAPIQREAEGFWRRAGAAVVRVLDAEAHDVLMARASHLPQLAATALAATFAALDVDPTRVGPGARDTTRLAASSYAMWQPLLASTPSATLDALAALEANVAALRTAVAKGDASAIRVLWDAGREWRQSADPAPPPSAKRSP